MHVPPTQKRPPSEVELMRNLRVTQGANATCANKKALSNEWPALFFNHICTDDFIRLWFTDLIGRLFQRFANTLRRSAGGQAAAAMALHVLPVLE